MTETRFKFFITTKLTLGIGILATAQERSLEDEHKDIAANLMIILNDVGLQSCQRWKK
jgi:selenophosphate synthase